MTFEEFQATGRDVPELRDVLDDDIWTGPGRVYHGKLFIALLDVPHSTRGLYCCPIGNCDWQSDDLTALEGRLYIFAVTEGICSMV
jgi:hypothetical protein